MGFSCTHAIQEQHKLQPNQASHVGLRREVKGGSILGSGVTDGGRRSVLGPPPGAPPPPRSASTAMAAAAAVATVAAVSIAVQVAAAATAVAAPDLHILKLEVAVSVC